MERKLRRICKARPLDFVKAVPYGTGRHGTTGEGNMGTTMRDDVFTDAELTILARTVIEANGGWATTAQILNAVSLLKKMLRGEAPAPTL